jgi:hypothetical protein
MEPKNRAIQISDQLESFRGGAMRCATWDASGELGGLLRLEPLVIAFGSQLMDFILA